MSLQETTACGVQAAALLPVQSLVLTKKKRRRAPLGNAAAARRVAELEKQLHDREAAAVEAETEVKAAASGCWCATAVGCRRAQAGPWMAYSYCLGQFRRTAAAQPSTRLPTVHIIASR